MKEMSPPELQEQLTGVERHQAGHEQLLRGLLDRFEDIVERFDRQEKRNEERFDTHEQRFREMETTKPPWANLIAFSAVAITLISVLGWMGTEPTRIEQRNQALKLERITDKMDDDDHNERTIAAALAKLHESDLRLASHTAQQESLNHHLHVTNNAKVNRLESLVFKKDWSD